MDENVMGVTATLGDNGRRGVWTKTFRFQLN